MYSTILKTVEQFHFENISNDRKNILQPLIDYIQGKVNSKKPVNLNFICTHNSRRSHLAQIYGYPNESSRVRKGI